MACTSDWAADISKPPQHTIITRRRSLEKVVTVVLISLCSIDATQGAARNHGLATPAIPRELDISLPLEHHPNSKNSGRSLDLFRTPGFIRLNSWVRRPYATADGWSFSLGSHSLSFRTTSYLHSQRCRHRSAGCCRRRGECGGYQQHNWAEPRNRNRSRRPLRGA